jgi:hypothetical protein
MQRIFIKNISCLRWEAFVMFHLGRKRFADEEEVETEVWQWLRQQSKDICCGFRRTGKAMRHVYQCW